MPTHAAVRRRVEAQGFLGLDEVALAEIGPWLRWSPAVCAVFMATGTILASPPMLWALAAIVAALLATTHFCIPSLVYNRLFRPRPTVGASVPRGA
jgi:hypothetical protein